MQSIIIVILVFTCKISSCFYVPGVAPVTYCEAGSEGCHRSNLTVFANRLNSVQTVLPYDYYRFGMCRPQPSDQADRPPTNLGLTLFGDRFVVSPYKLQFRKNIWCKRLCTVTYQPDQLSFLKSVISLNYQNHWMVDNMPVTWCYQVLTGAKFCSLGFPVGCYVTPQGVRRDTCVMNAKFGENDTFYVFNHVDIKVKYLPGEDNTHGRIISVTLEPRSVKEDRTVTGASVCASMSVQDIPGRDTGKPVNITYTYSVTWEVDYNGKWAARWDYILDQNPHTNIVLFSFANSSILVVFMVIISCVLLWRQTRRNRTATNKVDPSVNWDAISGDVFRAPKHLMLLTALIGNGIQVFCAALVTLVIASAGMLSPSNRGGLGLVGLVLLFIMGGQAACCSARLYKSFGGERHKLNAAFTMLLFPGLVYVLFLLLNFVSWTEGSSAAVPFSSLAELTALWLGISCLVTAAGAFLGYRWKRIEHPAEVSEIPRPVGRRKWWNRALIHATIGGILPFGCIFIQVFFILNAIWSQQVYYMYGFLLLIFVLLTLTCAVSTMLLCYFYLSSENYHWCWRSFLSSGFTGVYLFIYCIHYYFTKLELAGAASAVLYFGYSLLMSFLLFLMTGAVGFYACFSLVTKIYVYEKSREKSALDKEKTTFENILESRTVDMKAPFITGLQTEEKSESM